MPSPTQIEFTQNAKIIRGFRVYTIPAGTKADILRRVALDAVEASCVASCGEKIYFTQIGIGQPKSGVKFS